jgi:hypothetical protein
VNDLVEACTLVHEVDRLVMEAVEEVGRVGEGLHHSVRTDDREPVTGEHHLRP